MPEKEKEKWPQSLLEETGLPILFCPSQLNMVAKGYGTVSHASFAERSE